MFSLISAEPKLTVAAAKTVKRTYTGIVTRTELFLKHRPSSQLSKPEVSCRALIPYKPFVPWCPPTITLLVPLKSTIYDIGLPVPVLNSVPAVVPSAPAESEPCPASFTSGALIVYQKFDFYASSRCGLRKIPIEADNSLALVPFVQFHEPTPVQPDQDHSLLILVLISLILVVSLITSAIDYLGHAVESHLYYDTFEEATRMTSLLDSMDYDGDSFVSAVCPPLTPTGFNVVTLYSPLAIPNPKNEPTLACIIAEEVVADLKIVFKPIMPLLQNIFFGIPALNL